MSEVLDVAKMLRKTIRSKAGLPPDWEKASHGMKDWYIAQAKQTIRGDHGQDATG